MSAYYNENDKFAAAWLRELIKANLIAPGEVDERSIEDVQANDLRGFTQCHFFAGIGVWSYALRAAGWSDDSPVWTGSCPCQSFSASGKRGGFSDKRHLWPAWFRLISECRPHTIFGEQVASKDGLAWLDVVSADLEGKGYAIGAADICAAGFGAPHIRQRLYFVAHAERGSAERHRLELGAASRGLEREAHQRERVWNDARDGESVNRMADAAGRRCEQRNTSNGRVSEPHSDITFNELGDASNARLEGRKQRASRNGNRHRPEAHGPTSEPSQAPFAVADPGSEQDLAAAARRFHADTGERSATNGFWRDADWLYCRDGKFRPVEPGVAPLVAGATNRVGRLRGYGNAINAQVAQGFIEAYLEATN